MAHGRSNRRKQVWEKREGDLAPLNHMSKGNFLKGNEILLPEQEASNTQKAPVILWDIY